MQQFDKRGSRERETFAIGFAVYKNKGNKLQTNRPPRAQYK